MAEINETNNNSNTTNSYYDAMPSPPRNEKAWKFYEEVLKAPKKLVAPMVDASELPFRMLCRKYGAELCWTPMFHSRHFAISSEYRDGQFSTCPEDRPLIVQFCANDPEHFVKAAEFVYDHCDAICLNLGCPQEIARRGNYGAFLSDKDPDTVKTLVQTASTNFKVPIICKMRLKPTLEETIAFAKMLEAAGCQILTVHGRTKEMRGRNQGLADWNAIRAVKRALSIPVIANGNIRFYEDIEECLKATEAVAVMSAEALLKNPAFFAGPDLSAQPNRLQLAREYFDFCKKYPTNLSIIRGHLFKILKEIFDFNTDLREQLANTKTMEEIEAVIVELELRAEGKGTYPEENIVDKKQLARQEKLLKQQKDEEEKQQKQEQVEEEVFFNHLF